MSSTPTPVDRLSVSDSAFVLSLGWFHLVGFNTIHHADGEVTWGSTWICIDSPFWRWSTFLGGADVN